MTSPYRPIACAVHDHLEDLATRRVPCRITAREGTIERTVIATIRDVLAEGGAEYCVLSTGERIRLDLILTCEASPTDT